MYKLKLKGIRDDIGLKKRFYQYSVWARFKVYVIFLFTEEVGAITEWMN
jgi:hypothetical protein